LAQSWGRGAGIEDAPTNPLHRPGLAVLAPAVERCVRRRRLRRIARVQLEE
jgi:hypothetical protein